MKPSPSDMSDAELTAEIKHLKERLKNPTWADYLLGNDNRLRYLETELKMRGKGK